MVSGYGMFLSEAASLLLLAFSWGSRYAGFVEVWYWIVS